MAEEVTVRDLLADLDATRLGIIIVYPSPTSSTRRVRVTLGATEIGEVTIPKEYSDYVDVVSGDGDTKLPGHTKVRHSIEIEEGKEVPYGPIYPLNSYEL